jgi:hypothetical protein
MEQMTIRTKTGDFSSIDPYKMEVMLEEEEYECEISKNI